MKENDPLISELANIVGSEHVITDPTSLSVMNVTEQLCSKRSPMLSFSRQPHKRFQQ